MKTATVRLPLLTLAFLVALPALSLAQEAPAPRKAPRTPVNRQTTYERRSDAPASRNVQGAAVAIDGERLRVDSTDLRLFGIVPPQLSASFGPQARMALDQLVANKEVGCMIRDRSREGHLLASCRTAETDDLALELLKKGLAVAARGSLAGTELIQSYLLAEQEAQTQRMGLWSIALASSAQTTASAATASVSKPETAPPPVAAAPTTTETTKAESAKPEQHAVIVPSPAAFTESKTAAVSNAASVPVNPSGFFTRYQILIGNLLMLVTALSILTVFAQRQRHDRRDELKAIAAALRGELMAARAVCLARIKAIATEQDDYEATWPRIRATLYQAYVSHIGKLGAELARKIASIYGQSSDYALYYQSSEEAKLPKRQALAALIAHIEEVLPSLTAIEQIGDLTLAHRAVRARLGNASNVANATARRAAALAAPTQPTQSASAPESRLPPPPQHDNQSDQQEYTDAPQQDTVQESAAPSYEAPTQANVARSASVITSIWESLRRFAQGGRNAQPQPQQPATAYTEQQPTYEQPEDDSAYAYDENAQYVEEEQQQPPAPRAANGGNTRGT
ncbi:MAG: thermonuclease family protein [Bdellovibrionales bacterium]